EGSPINPEFGHEVSKVWHSGQELFPPGIELGFSRTIRPRESSLTT
ncbi:hypothetical protein A2U01_0062578, partial [Trifolium medium]|nr:hypothetical protein [Trifolium medium]